MDSRSPARLVAEFHEVFDISRRAIPGVPDSATADLRAELLREETAEAIEAIGTGDIAAIARELADVVYIAYGTALTYGIDLDAVIAEVHRANMSKLDADGRPVRRADGKVVKSDRFVPPDVASVLRRRTEQPDTIDSL